MYLSVYLVFGPRSSRDCAFWNWMWPGWQGRFVYPLGVPVKPSYQVGASRVEGCTTVFFWQDFQHGASKDHYGTLRRERKWLQHICARCWVDRGVAACHMEFSKEYPLAEEKDSNSRTSAPWLEPLEPLYPDFPCLQGARLSVSDFRLCSCLQDPISSVEDKYHLDSRLSEVVHSDYSSESPTPSLSSQVTVPLVINYNFNDVCSSL